jgi:putative MATE family efflux protein
MSQGFTVKLSRLLSLLRTAVTGEEKEFTTGSINRAIFMLSVPMVLEMAMESLFAVVDAFYVSRIGEAAAATVGLTEGVVTIVYAVGMGLGMTATAFVARRTGEKKMKEAGESAVQAILLTLLMSLPISAAGLFFAEDILKLMGASEAVLAQGVNYTRIVIGGNVIIMLLFLNNAILRGAGDASSAMRVLWLANILNIALGPVFIFGLGPIPAMGVTGAAVATTIGRGIGVLYQFYILFSGKALIRIHLRDFSPRASLIWEMFKVSLGGIGQSIIISASWIFLVRIISTFGDQAVAGYTYALRIIIFTILPSWGFSNAAATLVGQNLGAGQPERAERSVWKAALYNMIFLGLVAVVFFLFAENLIRIFSDNPVVIGHGVDCLRIICLGYLSFAYGMVMSQAFNGAGDTRTPIIMNIICFWMLQIPLAWALAIGFDIGVPGVYIAVVIADTALAVISIIWFRRGKWKQVKV